MPITRRALLISNPGEPNDREHWCGGVPIDIQRYMTFLQSAEGGYWYPSEIVHLPRPTLVEARLAIARLATADYSFVAFAGHGWYSQADRSTVLVLQKGVNLNSIELRASANKGTIVLDCCREQRPESAYMEQRSKMTFSAASLRRRDPSPYVCRPLFEQEIRECAPGLVVVESCQPGQTAADSDTTGGLYTSCLLNTAEEWTNRRGEEPGTYGNAALSIVAAHIPAAAQTEQQAGGGDTAQKPSILKARTSGKFFPFAVFG